jgi:hypothetical protein
VTGRGRLGDQEKEVDNYATVEGNNGLPMANLVRLMRQVVPTDVKILKRLTHECAVEFVGDEASECATPEDFMRSFHRLGLDDYVGPSSTYIRRYRENQNAPPSASFADEGGAVSDAVVPEPHGARILGWCGKLSLKPCTCRSNICRGLLHILRTEQKLYCYE